MTTYTKEKKSIGSDVVGQQTPSPKKKKRKINSPNRKSLRDQSLQLRKIVAAHIHTSEYMCVHWTVIV